MENSDKKYQCDECGMTFASSEHKRRHKNRRHRKVSVNTGSPAVIVVDKAVDTDARIASSEQNQVGSIPTLEVVSGENLPSVPSKKMKIASKLEHKSPLQKSHTPVVKLVCSNNREKEDIQRALGIKSRALGETWKELNEVRRQLKQVREEKDLVCLENEKLRHENRKLKRELQAADSTRRSLESAQQKIRMLEGKFKGANGDILTYRAALGSRAKVVITRLSQAEIKKLTLGAMERPPRSTPEINPSGNQSYSEITPGLAEEFDSIKDLLYERADFEVLEGDKDVLADLIEIASTL